MSARVLVLGSFDVLHYGHLEFLNEAAKLGEVIVGLGSDQYQEGYKRAPIQTYAERRRALNALGYDCVVRSKVNITALIKAVKPDYLAAGSDWIGQPFLELSGLTAKDLEYHNITLVYIPRSHDMSTSTILDRIGESRGTNPVPH